MATYSIRSFQTLNLPQVSIDTDFIIYRYPTSTPGDTLTNIVYTGKIVAGYSLNHVDELLSQYVYTENLVYTNDHIIQDDEQIFTFYLYTSTDDWTTFSTDTITVIYDWSYDYQPVYRKTTKSSIPIDFMDYRQFGIQSMMSRDGSQEAIQVTVGQTTIDNIVIEGSSTWTYFRYLNDGTILWPHAQGGDNMFINGKKYTVKNTCFKYCLYYLNQWGGYDYMLFSGREIQKDNLSRLSYTKNYVVNSSEFGKTNYLTTINETWSLNTSWLTDIQSEKFKHLFSSNKIWLQDLTEDSKIPHLVPVLITNSSYDHKNYKNQGRNLYSYTIEVSASQTKYRV